MSVPAPANRHPNPMDSGRSAVAGFLAEALARLGTLAERSRIALVTMPAPLAPARAVATMGAPAVLWTPPAGPSFAGIGCAVMLTASGSARIADTAAAAAEVWPRLEPMVYPGITPLPPRLFGGFAFAEGAASAAPWSDFGDARFILPRWLYTSDGERAQLTLAVSPADELDPRMFAARYLAELAAIHAVLEEASGPHSPISARSAVPVVPATIAAPGIHGTRDTHPGVHLHGAEPARWRQQVEDIRAAIAAGTCDKIVAARQSVVELARAVDPAMVLTSLDLRYSDCYRFCYRFGPSSMFVGATPERLIERAGDRIFTGALAGSIAMPEGTEHGVQARALLGSRKDRGEQDLVVQTIERVLAPLCTEIEVPDQPEIRTLRQVLHLHTPITGRLRQPTHVLDLVAALHPTPAVGGVPTDTALCWIAEREPAPRGWYAAPVGWFDAEGQGEFAVAIRSGVLAGRSAYIYAGAGIVQGSDPDAELAEIELKQGALLGALGVEL